MDWEFDCASHGNIALTGELDLDGKREFTMGLAFGDTEHSAISTLFQSLGTPFTEHLKTHAREWEQSSADVLPLEKFSTDKGNFAHTKINPIRARLSLPSRFLGERQKEMRIRAAITWSGLAT
jgi:glucoamylase